MSSAKAASASVSAQARKAATASPAATAAKIRPRARNAAAKEENGQCPRRQSTPHAQLTAVPTDFTRNTPPRRDQSTSWVHLAANAGTAPSNKAEGSQTPEGPRLTSNIASANRFDPIAVEATNVVDYEGSTPRSSPEPDDGPPTPTPPPRTTTATLAQDAHRPTTTAQAQERDSATHTAAPPTVPTAAPPSTPTHDNAAQPAPAYAPPQAPQPTQAAPPPPAPTHEPASQAPAPGPTFQPIAVDQPEAPLPPYPGHQNPLAQGQVPPNPAPGSMLARLMDRSALESSHAELLAPQTAAPAPVVTIFSPGPFPVALRSTPMAIFTRVPDTQVVTWEGVPGAKFIALVFDEIAGDIENHPTIASKIKRHTRDRTNFPSPLTAAPRQPVDGSPCGNAFLVHGIPDEVANIMIALRIHSSDDITFEALPLNQPIPRFLFPLAGFSEENGDFIRTFIRERWEDPDVGLELHHALEVAFLEGDTTLTAERAYAVMQSFDIEQVDLLTEGHVPRPRFNIIADTSPLRSDREWLFLISLLVKHVNYASDLFGTGTVEPPMECSLCHGAGHHRNLCPFPATPDWRGPIGRDSPKDFNSAAYRFRREEYRNSARGGRGRGRGKGTGYRGGRGAHRGARA
ncbi:hypothetical protein FA95DRAFT_1659530 [Auriscalpium vulgare]|uniref:Uncharacterized protein n=1 Tax=Auriscalpium vulgare TaxID=40419 RepID=A0ACB8RV56_9AGAM|nr:hypothetical protein FA95DRAFT_1659530 [Auriscalpium vulgare]